MGIDDNNNKKPSRKHGFLWNAERKNKKQMLGLIRMPYMVHFPDSNSVGRKRIKKERRVQLSTGEGDKYCKCSCTAHPRMEHRSLGRSADGSRCPPLSVSACLGVLVPPDCYGHQSVMSSTSDQSKEL
jgi:hypothetical protein